IMMLTGGSGSGKTEWLRSLIVELTSRGYPTLVLDLHGDIETDIPSLELDYRGLVGVNPLELLSTSDVDGGPQPNINRLIKLLTDAVEDGFSPVQQAFLRSILNLCYESAGIRQDDPTSWDRPVPTFDFIRDVLMQPDEVLAPLSHLSLVQEILASNMATIAAVKNRLLPILEHPAFNAKTVIPINSAFDTPMRVDLKALQTVDMQFIVADTLLNHIFIKAQSMGHVNSNSEFDKFRLFIIIDEVKILSGNRRDRDDNFHILNRLATEARKYGIGLVVASQLINHYGRDIRANAATKLVLRPMDVQEARLNAKEMQVDFELLQDLRLPGQCYYRSSVSEEAIPLRLYPLKNRPLKSFVD
ncbi:MAG: ATP-binding protein, partial [Candidatus Kariarchaeaceae archaeon]